MEPKFHIIDFLVIGAYLAVLIWMGFYFAKRNTTTNDFFLAGRRIPWWAATLRRELGVRVC